MTDGPALAGPTLRLRQMREQKALKTDTLAGGLAMLLGLTVVQRLIGFTRGILFCRWLDADQLGQWDLAFGFLMLAAPLAVFGLPGSLGRYVEFYRQRGQVNEFLRRVCVGTGVVAAASVAAVIWGREWFSEALFNRRDQSDFVSVLSVVLSTWILHTLLVAVFNALRMTRIVSVLQFVHSLGFAALGLGLLVAFEPTARSVLWSYAGASALSSGLGMIWLVRSWGCLSENPTTEPGPRYAARSLWKQLLPFALWVWIANALANLFGLADRWMMMQLSGLSEPEALAQLGQYHSARVVPLLFLGIAEMVAGLATPHLAHDWEAGRREEVSRRLNFILKLFAVCLFAAGTGLLLVSPLLFGVALAGKYAAGMALLPWTLMYCVWGSQAVVATNYLWCAERARWACFALLVGLLVNVALGSWLLPLYGLQGAVWGTSAANFAMLTSMYAAALLCGMRFDRGVCLTALAPVALLGGPWMALVALLLLAVLARWGHWLLTPDDRNQIALSSAARNLQRLVGRRSQSQLTHTAMRKITDIGAKTS
jgi:PST family polysaccharide transporter